MNTQIETIRQLKAERDAVILAHYYVPDEVQAVADYIGDSFYLSKTAAALPNKTIVFCGVKFMGESAKMLSPDKAVLMPDIHADCPMAHLAIPEDVAKIRSQYDDLAVVCYINSTTELKSVSDVCVTSSNAINVVKKLPQHNIYFIPDQNLAHYVAAKIPEKNFIFNDGYCPTHKKITTNDINISKSQHPEALVLAHPECTGDVLLISDFIGSTSEIIDFATASQAKEFLIATEIGVICELKKRNPDKEFYPAASNLICPNMKMNSVEKIIEVLENMSNQVFVDPEVTKSASLPLVKMLELAK